MGLGFVMFRAPVAPREIDLHKLGMIPSLWVLTPSLKGFEPSWLQFERQTRDHTRVSEAKQRVLVVDDEPVVRKIAERVLRREQIEVVTASDGTQAMQALAANTDIGLILLDASLPDMNAERVLELMQAAGNTTQVLLSSGFGEESLPTREQFPNVCGYLPKPYSVAKLAEKVREYLA